MQYTFMIKKTGLVLAIMLLFAIIAAGCCGGTNTTVDQSGSVASGSSSVSGSSSTASDLQLVESHVDTGDYGLKYVVGTIKNTGGKTYRYVQVTINLYDNSGTQVGSTLANVNNLEPGGTWKFKAYWTEKDATNYKIKEITGF